MSICKQCHGDGVKSDPETGVPKQTCYPCNGTGRAPAWMELGADSGLVARMIAAFPGLAEATGDEGEADVNGANLVDWLNAEIFALDHAAVRCLAKHGTPWDFEYREGEPGFHRCQTCGGLVENEERKGD